VPIFVTDRFGQINSAIPLNGIYLVAPSGTYFNSTEFSISLWLYISSSSTIGTILNFWPSYTNAIIISLIKQQIISFRLYNSASSLILDIDTTSQSLNVNQWQFVVITFDGFEACIYINSILINKKRLISLRSDFMSTNLVQNLNSLGQGFTLNSYLVLDDLRFYNKSLNQSQIYVYMFTDDSTLMANCFKPILNIDKLSNRNQALVVKRSEMLILSGMTQINCMQYMINTKQWLIFKINATSGDREEEIILKNNPTLEYADLVIQPNTLDYGLYKFTFKVTLSNFNLISSHIDTYVNLTPSGLVVQALRLNGIKNNGGGIIEVTHGLNESIQFNPYLNS
jgi:hypothetical protein